MGPLEKDRMEYMDTHKKAIAMFDTHGGWIIRRYLTEDEAIALQRANRGRAFSFNPLTADVTAIRERLFRMMEHNDIVPKDL